MDAARILTYTGELEIEQWLLQICKDPCRVVGVWYPERMALSLEYPEEKEPVLMGVFEESVMYALTDVRRLWFCGVERTEVQKCTNLD